MNLLIQEINHPLANSAGIKLSMARADLLHPLASGNKFYKLEPNLKFAKQQSFSQILSFGGAYSNHIHAVALTAKEQGFKSIGIIRGEKRYASNPTLQEVKSAGMQLYFINREEYKRRNDSDYIAKLQQRFPKALIIPEGGSSQLAIQGCVRLADEINAIQSSDILTVACGTGATFAGVVCGLKDGQSAIGYSALRDSSLSERISGFIQKEKAQNNNYKIEVADYGGFAKLNKELLDFIFDWLDETGILLDPIYTSKMCMRLMHQLRSREFSSGTSITIIHSGGLQGWRGMRKRIIQLDGEKSWQRIALELGKVS